jgi:hypothetical protein
MNWKIDFLDALMHKDEETFNKVKSGWYPERWDRKGNEFWTASYAGFWKEHYEQQSQGQPQRTIHSKPFVGKIWENIQARSRLRRARD